MKEAVYFLIIISFLAVMFIEPPQKRNKKILILISDDRIIGYAHDRITATVKCRARRYSGQLVEKLVSSAYESYLILNYERLD